MNSSQNQGFQIHGLGLQLLWPLIKKSEFKWQTHSVVCNKTTGVSKALGFRFPLYPMCLLPIKRKHALVFMAHLEQFLFSPISLWHFPHITESSPIYTDLKCAEKGSYLKYREKNVQSQSSWTHSTRETHVRKTMESNVRSLKFSLTQPA